MKKTYMKPAMQAVKIQQHGIICYSKGAKSFGDSPEEFNWTDDMTEDDV